MFSDSEWKMKEMRKTVVNGRGFVWVTTMKVSNTVELWCGGDVGTRRGVVMVVKLEQ